MRSIVFSVIFFLCPLVLISQKKERFSFQGIIGTKIFTDLYLGPNLNEAWPLKSGLLLGFELSYSKWPKISFSYLHDRHYQFYNLERKYPIQPGVFNSNLLSSGRGNYFGFYYNHKNMKYGIANYNSLHEDIVNYIFPNGNFVKSHIAFSYAIKFGRAEFEFVKLIQYKKLFAVFDIDLQYVNIKYRLFDAKNVSVSKLPKKGTKSSLAFKIGLRGFPVKNDYLSGEDKKRLGASFQTGLEWKFKKINTSLFADRDWWVRLNGGSPYRDVNGYVVNSVLGIKYSMPKLNDAFVSIGYNWTTDYNTIYQIWDEYYSGNRKRVDLYFYNVKGIALGLGIPVFEKFDLDLRGILPIRGEKIGNPMRFSLGLVYKINP